MNKSIQMVEKEQISKFNFSTNDVLQSDLEKRKRMEKLMKATTLGNAFKTKVKILFQTFEGEIMKVETTAWAVGDRFVSLKAGTHIPISSIVDVEF